MLAQSPKMLAETLGVDVASIRTKELTKGRVSYTVSWREPGGAMKSKVYYDFSQADELKRFLDANGNSFALANQAKGKLRSTAPTVAQAIASHIDQLGGDVEPGTKGTYRGMIPIYFPYSGIGSLPIDQMTVSHVRAWFDAIDRSPKTKKNVHALLSAALRTQLRADSPHIKTNVAEGIRSPKSNKKTKDPVFMTKREIESLVEAMPHEAYKRMVDLTAYTGLRFGEVTALHGRHIRHYRGRVQIHVREAWKRHAGRGNGQPLGAPKTSKGTRTITLGAKAAERFLPWMEGIGDDELVFTVPTTGAQITSSYFGRIVWNPAVESLMDESDGQKKRLHARPTPHDLRHTHASMMIEQGVDLVVIQDRLGHESITTTVHTYGHLRIDADANAADLLD